MHRDLKLGLALAVLLIGATTAFFFRNETDVDAGLPKLRDPVRLDGEIATREIAPYPIESTPDDPDLSPWTKPAFLGGHKTTAFRQVSLIPNPIQIVLEEEPHEIEPMPTLGDLAPPERRREAGGRATHIVQSGDTLSGIAMRYLGSTARFSEIYELNRDRLKDPHDLRIGTPLLVPTTGPPTAGAVTPQDEARNDLPGAEASVLDGPSSENVPDVKAAEEATTSLSTEADQRTEPPGSAERATSTSGPALANPPAEKLFVPARKTPFMPGRFRPPAIPAAKAEPQTDGKR